MITTEHKPRWVVERQAFCGQYWETISFGPFRTKEEAEEFCRLPQGGVIFDESLEARRSIA